MPRPGPAVRVTINGSMGQGEVFSTGFWVAGTTPISQAAATTAATAFATAANTPLTGLATILASDGAYQSIKIYWYPNVEPAPAAFITSNAISYPGTGAATPPLQTCLVASLRTANLVRSGRGRMYIPASGIGLANHEATSATCTNVATAIKQLFAAAVANLLTGSPAAIVNSSRNGTLQPITQVIVDSRTDVQRRRAQKETVLFSSTASIP